jgi:hypothetical protein
MSYNTIFCSPFHFIRYRHTAPHPLPFNWARLGLQVDELCIPRVLGRLALVRPYPHYEFSTIGSISTSLCAPGGGDLDRKPSRVRLFCMASEALIKYTRVHENGFTAHSVKVTGLAQKFQVGPIF